MSQLLLLMSHQHQLTMSQSHTILQLQSTMNLHLTILQLQLTMNQHPIIHQSLIMTHITRNIMTHTTMSMESLEFLARTIPVLLKPRAQSLVASPFHFAQECTLILSLDARHTECVMMEEMVPLVQGLSALMVPCLISTSLLVSFGTRLTVARLFPCMN